MKTGSFSVMTSLTNWNTFTLPCPIKLPNSLIISQFVNILWVLVKRDDACFISLTYITSNGKKLSYMDPLDDFLNGTVYIYIYHLHNLQSKIISNEREMQQKKCRICLYISKKPPKKLPNNPSTSTISLNNNGL